MTKYMKDRDFPDLKTVFFSPLVLMKTTNEKKTVLKNKNKKFILE